METSPQTPQVRALDLFVPMMAFAFPAWANNPPRPDGALYLALVFPIALTACYFARVTAPQRRPLARIGRGVFFTFVVLLSTAGTELGLLAMLVVVGYGLMRAVQISRQRGGAKTTALATLVVITTLTAGVGYIWALGTGSAKALAQARQKRTFADLRNTGVAVSSWSLDQLDAADEHAARPQASFREMGENTTPDSTDPASLRTEKTRDLANFAHTEAPPLISHAELKALLVPDYMSDLSELDGWRNPYELRLDRQTRRFWMRSAGRDGRYEAEAYALGPFEPTDLDGDLVWVEGQIWRWPAAIDL